jgi:hypothetical protein
MVDRRDVLAGVGSVSSIAIAGCSALDGITGPSEEEVKQEAESPSWEEIFRNNSEWEGEPVTYSGVRIIDVIEEEGDFNLIIQHPDNDGFGSDAYLYCRWDGDPFQDQDTVNLWGIVEGTHTYTSLTGEMTVPDIDLVDIQLSG